MLVFVFTMPAMAQPSKLPADSVKKMTDAIRKEYNRINSLKNLHCTEEGIEGESAEGATLNKYYYNNQLVKATFTWFGETGKTIGEYYLKDGKAVFYYEMNERYNHHIADTSSKLTVVEKIQTRCYFHNNKLIYWLKGDALQPMEGYPQQEREILASVKDHLQQAISNSLINILQALYKSFPCFPAKA